MSLDLASSVESHYDRCASLVDDDAQAMGWSSAFNQRLRFEVINYLVDMTGLNVLDVGCGDAALFHYFLDQNMDVIYKGIDISEKMVQRAQFRYPGIPVRKCDFINYKGNHDVVVCSGGLSMCPDQDPMHYLSQSLDHFLAISNEHVVFNLLSSYSGNMDSLFNYYSPKDVINLCFEKTRYVTMHHSYLPNDFTVHLIKV